MKKQEKWGEGQVVSSGVWKTKIDENVELELISDDQHLTQLRLLTKGKETVEPGILPLYGELPFARDLTQSAGSKLFSNMRKWLKSAGVNVTDYKLFQALDHLQIKYDETASSAAEKDKPEPVPPEVRARADELKKNPRLLLTVLDVQNKLSIGETKNKLLLDLIIPSCKTTKPLSVIIGGTSNGGKTMLANSAFRIMPQNWVEKIGGFSAHALIYMARKLEKNPRAILYLQEFRGMSEIGNQTIKLMSSDDGGFTYWVTEKDKNGQFNVTEIKVPVKALATTTTQLQLDNETENRTVRINIDAGNALTRSVIHHQAMLATTGQFNANAPPSIDELALRVIFSELPYDAEIRIPFAPLLENQFKDLSVKARRDFPKYLRIIMMCALEHFSCRPRFRNANGKLVVFALPVDAIIVYEIAKDILAASLRSLTVETSRALEIFKTAFKENYVTSVILAKKMGISTESAKYHLDKLERDAYILEYNPDGGTHNPKKYEPLGDGKPASVEGFAVDFIDLALEAIKKAVAEATAAGHTVDGVEFLRPELQKNYLSDRLRDAAMPIPIEMQEPAPETKENAANWVFPAQLPQKDSVVKEGEQHGGG